MFEILSILCLLFGFILLIILSVIDLRTYLLPNIYVFPFALLGIIFHIFTQFDYLSPLEIAIGGLAGYGLLWLIRYGGNKYYGQDSLGLGDVKLLGAAGFWLGLQGVLFAMTLGAFAGLLHGIGVAIHRKLTTGQPFSITRIMIPAGPGFALGITLTAGWLYYSHVLRFVYDIF